MSDTKTRNADLGEYGKEAIHSSKTLISEDFLRDPELDADVKAVILTLKQFPDEVEKIISDLVQGLEEAFGTLPADSALLLKEFFQSLGHYTMLRYYVSMEQTIASGRSHDLNVIRALNLLRTQVFASEYAFMSEEGQQFGAMLMQQEPMLEHFCIYLVERIQELSELLFQRTFVGLSTLKEFNVMISRAFKG